MAWFSFYYNPALFSPWTCFLCCRCLVYQACVFNFGNEFCQKDPNPGSRKNINLNITCVRDEFKTRIENVSPDQVEERINSVLNIVFQSKLDFGIEDFENTVLTDRAVPEKFVFDSGCPIEPYSAGYRGTCTPVEQLENSTVAENTWHLTSRIRWTFLINRVLMKFLINHSSLHPTIYLTNQPSM